MKRIITLLFISVVLFACGAPKKDSLEQKKKDLVEYKKELAELQKKINELEKFIAANDTTSDLGKKKLVILQPVKPGPFQHYVEIQGTIDSDENVFVTSAAPGLVTNINVKEGDKVGKGTVLASTESTALQNSLVEVNTALDLATIAYEKQKRLWDQKIGSEIQYLQAKNQMESLQARQKSVQSQINMSKFISPINGTVDEVNVKLGEMASPGYTGIRVVNLDNIKATAKVSDIYISKIKKGAPVIIYVPDVDKTIETKISFVSQAVSSASRSFLIEIKLDNKDKMLRPNLIAKIKINDETIDNALTIPSKVIQKNIDGTSYIMIAEKQKDGSYTAKKANIKTGNDSNGVTVVTEGLKEGDVVITDGYQDLIEGQSVITQ